MHVLGPSDRGRGTEGNKRVIEPQLVSPVGFPRRAAISTPARFGRTRSKRVDVAGSGQSAHAEGDMARWPARLPGISRTIEISEYDMTVATKSHRVIDKPGPTVQGAAGNPIIGEVGARHDESTRLSGQTTHDDPPAQTLRRFLIHEPRVGLETEPRDHDEPVPSLCKPLRRLSDMHQSPVSQDRKQLSTQGWTELGDDDQIGCMRDDFERDMR